MQQTLSILKPDSIRKNKIGEIIALLESQNLKVAAAKMVHLTEHEASAFYSVHKERPFFGELVAFMCSGPILVMVLEGDDAIVKNREIMGDTDPKKAKPHTIRAKFGDGIESNAIHGSDSAETAKTEIAFFFKREEIFSASKS
jgi:nucleoside-diphosphate kinase